MQSCTSLAYDSRTNGLSCLLGDASREVQSQIALAAWVVACGGQADIVVFLRLRGSLVRLSLPRELLVRERHLECTSIDRSGRSDVV